MDETRVRRSTFPPGSSTTTSESAAKIQKGRKTASTPLTVGAVKYGVELLTQASKVERASAGERLKGMASVPPPDEDEDDAARASLGGPPQEGGSDSLGGKGKDGADAKSLGLASGNEPPDVGHGAAVLDGAATKCEMARRDDAPTHCAPHAPWCAWTRLWARRTRHAESDILRRAQCL